MEHVLERSWAHEHHRTTPRKGDHIEPIRRRLGAPVRGTVWHVDQVQVLVKWDDGRSEGLRAKFNERFRIVDEPD